MVSTPRDLQVNIDFLNIGQIDNLNEKFAAEIRIESTWCETEYSDLIVYDPEKHWNPRLYVQNLLNETKDIIKYRVHKETNCLIIKEIRTVRGHFWERLELKNLPFDQQELNIIIKSKYDSNHINLLADTEHYQLLNQETKHTFVDQQKWRLLNIVKMRHSFEKPKHHSFFHFTDSFEHSMHKSNSVSVSMQEKIPKKYSKLVATCYCSRRPGFYLFNAFFLIFLITLSSLTVFSIPPELPANRLQITYTILLSSISFKWVFNRSLPPVSYLTLLDKYSIFCIIYINMLAAWHSLIGSEYWRALIRYNHLHDAIDFYMLIFLVLLFLFFHLFTIAWYFQITKKHRFLIAKEKEFIESYLLKMNKKSLDEDDEDEE